MALFAWLARRPVLSAVAWGASVNVVVHSLFWIALPRIAVWGLLGLWLAESAVTGVEGMVYWRVLRLRLPVALVLSALLNLASWGIGSRVLLWLM